MKKFKKNLVRHICMVLVSFGLLSLLIGPVHNVEAVDYYQIVVDGKAYGAYKTRQEAAKTVVEARVKANEESEDIVLSDFDYEIQKTDKKENTENADNVNSADELCKIMLDNQVSDMTTQFVLKSGSYSVTLPDLQSVQWVLDQLVDQYDTYNEFGVVFNDSTCDTQNIFKADIVQQTEALTGDVTSIIFTKDVEVMKIRGSKDEASVVDDVVADLVNEDKINVTMTKRQNYTEEYNLDTEYIEVDDWYTSEQKVIKEAVTGLHDVTAEVTYLNGVEMSREILQDVVLVEPVAKVVKVGTKEAPTFIKPIRGGSFSSGFGSRWGRKHEGVDWSCSVGTTVMASSGGTVTFAGWQNGYGNTIVISHGNGIKTRYAHLNKIAVSDGQKVSQGDTIGYSGNTGRSTGPHLHFEVLLNGEAVNPLKYL